MPRRNRAPESKACDEEVVPDPPQPIGVRGAANNKMNGHPVHLLNPRPSQPPAELFLEYVFGRFSATRGVQKRHKNVFTKSPGQNIFTQKSIKFSMSVFPRFFLFYRGFGCFSAMGVQKYYKKRFYKKHRVEKFSRTKKSTKIPNHFLSICFITFFGRFSAKGSSKTSPTKI
jgi:hypothetical protein